MVPTQSPKHTSDIVYKLLDQDEWRTACQVGRYDGSQDDKRDGFIHLSAANQLAGTAAKYFRGQSDLVLIGFSAKDLEPDLMWEISRGGALFPHYYGALPTSAAQSTDPITLDDDGKPILPGNLGYTATCTG